VPNTTIEQFESQLSFFDTLNNHNDFDWWGNLINDLDNECEEEVELDNYTEKTVIRMKAKTLVECSAGEPKLDEKYKKGETKRIVSPKSPIGLSILERLDWFYQQ
jgi:hypothetical protein